MITDNPIATIVISTKNRKDDLRTALISVLMQTAPIEVIVIDDGSTDGTSDMVKTEFPGVRLYRHEKSMGLIVQRNSAAKLAQAPIIFSIDDDAVFTDNSIVTDIVAQFDNPRIGAVTIPYINVNSSKNILQSTPDPDPSNIYVFAHYTGCAHALRRDIFLSLEGYKEYFFHQGEEGEYCIRMLDAGYFVRLGHSLPIHHFESPIRDHSRSYYYGKRNQILFALYNVPSLFLLPHFIMTIINGLIHGMYNNKLRVCFDGTLAGICAIPQQLQNRRPVRISTYLLHRKLKKSNGLLLKKLLH